MKIQVSGVMSLAAGVVLAGCAGDATTPKQKAEVFRSGARDGLVVGTLVGRDGRITILATPEGTRYDVLSAERRLIAAHITAAEVARRTGEDPRGAWAAPLMDDREPLLLMMAEPRLGPLGRD